MSTTHTAAPWAVVERLGGNPSVIAVADGRGILSTGNARTIPHAEKVANATLAAAAPDLLAALRNLISINAAQLEELSLGQQAAIRRAEAAIAKAVHS